MTQLEADQVGSVGSVGSRGVTWGHVGTVVAATQIIGKNAEKDKII